VTQRRSRFDLPQHSKAVFLN